MSKLRRFCVVTDVIFQGSSCCLLQSFYINTELLQSEHNVTPCRNHGFLMLLNDFAGVGTGGRAAQETGRRNED